MLFSEILNSWFVPTEHHYSVNTILLWEIEIRFLQNLVWFFFYYSYSGRFLPEHFQKQIESLLSLGLNSTLQAIWLNHSYTKYLLLEES